MISTPMSVYAARMRLRKLSNSPTRTEHNQLAEGRAHENGG